MQGPILCERYINQESFTATLCYRKKFRGTCGTSHFLTKPTNDVKRKRKDEKGRKEKRELRREREEKGRQWIATIPSFRPLLFCHLALFPPKHRIYIPATPASVCYLYPASVSNLKRNKIVQGRYRV